MKDYYKILETSFGASQTEVKNQYHFLLHAWHPDKFPLSTDKLKAQEKTRELNEAYEVLGNPANREKYDQQYRAGIRNQANEENLPPPADFGWLLKFNPKKHYSNWTDAGIQQAEWCEKNTADIRAAWQENEYIFAVTKPGKQAIEAYPRAISDFVVSVDLRFLTNSSALSQAGLAFGIGYRRYLPASYYRFGIAKNGDWQFSEKDQSQPRFTYAHGHLPNLSDQLVNGEVVTLSVAAFENQVSLGIQQAVVGSVLHLPGPVCGCVGIFIESPTGSGACGAGFSNYRPYYIKED